MGGACPSSSPRTAIFILRICQTKTNHNNNNNTDNIIMILLGQRRDRTTKILDTTIQY